jgi:uncharacterized protein (UPF0147 family)
MKSNSPKADHVQQLPRKVRRQVEAAQRKLQKQSNGKKPKPVASVIAAPDKTQ